MSETRQEMPTTTTPLDLSGTPTEGVNKLVEWARKSPTPTLDQVSKERLMRENLRMLVKEPAWECCLLWIAIWGICNVRITAAKEVCRELGWNPDQTVGEFLKGGG